MRIRLALLLLAVPVALWSGFMVSGVATGDDRCLEKPGAHVEGASTEQDWRWLPPRVVCRVTSPTGETTSYVDVPYRFLVATALFLLAAWVTLFVIFRRSPHPQR